MITYKNILIVKYGALGDVVRTSFFMKALSNQICEGEAHVRIYWLTTSQSLPLLRFHPYIDVVTTNPNELSAIEFDRIYSLDDEFEVLSSVAKLKARKIIGASLSPEGKQIYCDQSAYWFDMGLLSRHGKERADELKRSNNRTHSDIFRGIFDVASVDFSFYNSEHINSKMLASIRHSADGRVAVGLNAFAGKRWASKALPDVEFAKLAEALTNLTIFGREVHLFLIGSGSDLSKNQAYLNSRVAPKNVTALNTDSNVLDLAAAVRSLKLLITTDSLCLHLAVSQQVPTVAFFAPTSAAEIENLKTVHKLKSLSDDYCNYRTDADNSSITSERIMQAVNHLFVSYIND